MGVLSYQVLVAPARCRRDRRPRRDRPTGCTATCASTTAGPSLDLRPQRSRAGRRSSSGRRATTRSTTRRPGSCSCSRPALEPLGLALTRRPKCRRSATAPRLLDIADRSRPHPAVEQRASPGRRPDVPAAGRRPAGGDRRRAAALRAAAARGACPRGCCSRVVIGRWMAARALAPLVSMAEAARAIDVADLRQRLPAARRAATSSTRWRTPSTRRSAG